LARILTQHEINASKTLLEMLSYCRPEGSKHQHKFIRRYLTPLGVLQDADGNCMISIDRPDGEPSKVLWSSHTDTVHAKSGKQEVSISGEHIKLRHGSNSNCLGADCTTGVWIMTEMIKAKIPGFYVFHAGEEVGGTGSAAIRDENPEILKPMKYAIAFDRMAATSIITHQGGSRCCSEDFALSLDKALGGGFNQDAGGSFTDTANYVGHIGECTNISVGYSNQHSRSEIQHIPTALKLREKMLAFDEDILVSKREPGEREARDWSDFGDFGWSHRSLSKKWNTRWDDEDDHSITKAGKLVRGKQPAPKMIDTQSNFAKLLRLVKDNPELAASFLDDYGINDFEMEEYGFENGHTVRF